MKNEEVMSPTEWFHPDNYACNLNGKMAIAMKEYAEYYHSAMQPKTPEEVRKAIDWDKLKVEWDKDSNIPFGRMQSWAFDWFKSHLPSINCSDAVEFAEWVGNNLWEMILTPNESWVNAESNDCKTTVELYRLFLTSKK